MSDSYICLVPIDPYVVPSPESRSGIIAAVRRLFPDSDLIDDVVSSGIQFIDCGSNLDSITCCHCKAVISDGAWGDLMSIDYKDSQQGFLLQAYQMPCCGTTARLCDLKYDFDIGFARFCIRIRNTNRLSNLPSAIAAIRTIFGIDIKPVYRHV